MCVDCCTTMVGGERAKGRGSGGVASRACGSFNRAKALLTAAVGVVERGEVVESPLEAAVPANVVKPLQKRTVLYFLMDMDLNTM